MLIQLLRRTMIAGEPVDAGSTVDVDASVATLLIGIGKAELAPPAPPADPAPEAPEPPKPARTTRKAATPAPTPES